MNKINELTGKIIGCAIEVHKHLGPGLLESTYESCLAFELSKIGMRVKRQAGLPIIYKQLELKEGYRMDLWVEDTVVIEVKAIEKTADIHVAQLLTYLKFSGSPIGLLINFNVLELKDGIKRIIPKDFLATEEH